MNALSKIHVGKAAAATRYPLRVAEIYRRIGLRPAVQDLTWPSRGVGSCASKASQNCVTDRITFPSQSATGEPVPQHVTAVVHHPDIVGQGLRMGLPDDLSIPSRNRRVLVVEDEPEVAELEQLILESAGFRVLRAGNGLDGLRMVQSEPLAAVVLDADLPGMDGFEICMRIRANPFTRLLPVLFLSGNANAPFLALAAGADKVLAKPEGISELASALSELLRT